MTQLIIDLLHYSLYQILRKRISATTLSRNIADSYGCLAIMMIYVTLQVLCTFVSEFSSGTGLIGEVLFIVFFICNAVK